jgi:hypothetical protein
VEDFKWRPTVLMQLLIYRSVEASYIRHQRFMVAQEAPGTMAHLVLNLKKTSDVNGGSELFAPVTM